MMMPRIIEALLFSAQKPLSTKEIVDVLRRPGGEDEFSPNEFARVREAEVAAALEQLKIQCIEQQRAFQLSEKAEGWQLTTDPKYAQWVRELFPAAKPARLTAPALETLAIIAYLQPVSRPEIARIRGVGADSAVSGLLERGLIEEAGRADSPGSPVVYRVTNAFQRVFGIDDQQGLPELSEFELTEDDHQALRARLHLVADQRAGQA